MAMSAVHYVDGIHNLEQLDRIQKSGISTKKQSNGNFTIMIYQKLLGTLTIIYVKG